MKTIRFLSLLTFVLLVSCKGTSSSEMKITVPAPRQVAWHAMQYYAFIHFNMNTFSDMEWGTGGEDPALFNPTDLDVNQWVHVIKEAGMTGVIITAKHHDGFCLWPTAYGEHSIKHSPYKNGKGDIVKELAEACKREGLKFGVYLSPWDRNHKDYGKPEYVSYFHNQLRELLTNYGEIFEVWFDGANGGSGYYGGANETRTIDAKTYYQWDKTYAIVRELQPKAVIFGDDGPDIRWIGNEKGFGSETNWATFTPNDLPYGKEHIKHLQEGDPNGKNWTPAEADVSIRPGWYYHAREDHQVKSVAALVDIYYKSIGRNANLLLNLPVDRRGHIPEVDARRLMEFKQVIAADFANEVKGKFSEKDNVLTLQFTKPTKLNRLVLGEDITQGQRVSGFEVLYQKDGQWQKLATETTIGYKRVLRFPTVEATAVRLKVLSSIAEPKVVALKAYDAPALLTAPQLTRTKEGVVSLATDEAGLAIYYTTDGSAPTAQSKAYTAPFAVEKPVQLKAVAYDPATKKYSEIAAYTLDVPKAQWKVVAVSSGDMKGAAALIDENPNNWYTNKREGTSAPVVTIDLGSELTLKGFTYLPSQDRWAEGTISHYTFEVSTDGQHFKKVAGGEFGNIKNNPIEQRINFPAAKTRYIRLTADKLVDEAKGASYGEIGVITQ